MNEGHDIIFVQGRFKCFDFECLTSMTDSDNWETNACHYPALRRMVQSRLNDQHSHSAAEICATIYEMMIQICYTHEFRSCPKEILALQLPEAGALEALAFFESGQFTEFLENMRRL